jgi:hypothetical protein
MVLSQPMTPAQIEVSETAFAITVDFVRGQGDPSRPFRAMVDLTGALARFDEDLVKSVDITIEPVLLLENVESGSIKSWFVSVLRSPDDTALKSGDWKKVVGSYLVQAKYALLNHLSGAESVTDPQLLEGIQTDLLLEAEKTNVRGLPGYMPMSRTHLAAHIADMTSSLKYLEAGDSATYEARHGDAVPFNQSLRVNEFVLTEMLAVRQVANDNELILKVKKADFLGHSMWEFRYDGHPIEARIADYEWLDNYHRGIVEVRPGGALRAIVRIEMAYDDQNESLPPRYTILKVEEVLPPPIPSEPQFLRLQ